MPYKILVSYELTPHNKFFTTIMVTESDQDLPRSVLISRDNYNKEYTTPELYLGPFNTPEDAKAAVKPIMASTMELILKLRRREVPKSEIIEI